MYLLYDVDGAESSKLFLFSCFAELWWCGRVFALRASYLVFVGIGNLCDFSSLRPVGCGSSCVPPICVDQ